MFSSLPPSINAEWQILQKQDSPGAALRRLPKLLELIKNSSETKNFYNQVAKAVEVKDNSLNDDLEKSMQWVNETFDLLKKSSKASLIQAELQEFNNLLKGHFVIGPSCIDRSLRFLCNAISKLSHEGEAVDHIINDNGECCFDIVKEGLSKCLYPSFVNNAIKNTTREAKREFEELVKNDSPTLFRHLHVLSQYATFTPLSLPLSKEKIPTNWRESEAINYQAIVGFYLSGFGSKKQKDHPYTLQELLKQIEVFLLMVEAETILPQDALAACDTPYEIHNKSIIRKKEPNPDEFLAKSFILSTRRKDPTLSRDCMVDKIILAVSQERLPLSRDYRPSTYKNWDRDVDPVEDMKVKLSRPKTKNRRE